MPTEAEGYRATTKVLHWLTVGLLDLARRSPTTTTCCRCTWRATWFRTPRRRST